MKHLKNARTLRLVAIAASVLIAAAITWDAASYDLPIPLLAIVGLAVLSAFLHVTGELADRLATRRMACPDCTFAVRLTGTSDSENERWRAQVANHPHHH